MEKHELNGNHNNGNFNSGRYNNGNYNAGNCNNGHYNTGNWNTGDHNNGHCNCSDFNTGDYNCDSFNSGNWNCGNHNSGHYNNGNHNSGNFNNGNYNNGNHNTGSWNTGNYNNGFFNTDDAYVRMFNKETTLKKSEINLPSFLYFDLTEWITEDLATEEEKVQHKKELEICGGFLKTLEYKKAFRIAWDKASKDEHKKLLDLPNWNNEIFKEISGIDAEEEIAKETETETETIDLVDVYIAVMNYGSGNIDMYTVQMTPNYQIEDVEDWLYSNTNFSCSDCYYMCSSSEIRVDYV